MGQCWASSDNLNGALVLVRASSPDAYNLRAMLVSRLASACSGRSTTDCPECKKARCAIHCIAWVSAIDDYTLTGIIATVSDDSGGYIARGVANALGFICQTARVRVVDSVHRQTEIQLEVLLCLHGHGKS